MNSSLEMQICSTARVHASLLLPAHARPLSCVVLDWELYFAGLEACLSIFFMLFAGLDAWLSIIIYIVFLAPSAARCFDKATRDCSH